MERLRGSGLHKLTQIVQHHSCKGWICTDCPVYERCWNIIADVPINGAIPEGHPILSIANKMYIEYNQNSWLESL